MDYVHLNELLFRMFGWLSQGFLTYNLIKWYQRCHSSSLSGQSTQQLPFSMQEKRKEIKSSGKNEPQTNIFGRKKLLKGFPNRLPYLGLPYDCIRLTGSEISKLPSVDFSSLLSLVSIKKCFDLASICLKYETQWQHAHIQNKNSKRVPQHERAKQRKTQEDCILCHDNLASTSYSFFSSFLFLLFNRE